MNKVREDSSTALISAAFLRPAGLSELDLSANSCLFLPSSFGSVMVFNKLGIALSIAIRFVSPNSALVAREMGTRVRSEGYDCDNGDETDIMGIIRL
jgi:hypothetical protein